MENAMNDEIFFEQASAVLAACRSKGLQVAMAESCTGGLLVARLVDRAGSSAYVAGGTVAYSNEAKVSQLDVPAETLAAHGAVSPQVARALADGARQRFGAEIGVGITGVAGPDGGTATKPVGLVHFAASARGGRAIHRERRFGDIGRSEVRRLSVLEALAMLSELAGSAKP
jgi:nicotinamide-nucleotide amidase